MSEEPMACPRCGGLEPFHPKTPQDAKVCTPLSCSEWRKVGVLRKGGKSLILVDPKVES